MESRLLIALLAASFTAQSQPNCTGVTLDVDARCACIKDSHSQLCEMVKSGFYEPHDYAKEMQANWGLGGKIAPSPANRTAQRAGGATPTCAAAAGPRGSFGAQRLLAFPPAQCSTGGGHRFRKGFPVAGADGRLVRAGRGRTTATKLSPR